VFGDDFVNDIVTICRMDWPVKTNLITGDVARD